MNNNTTIKYEVKKVADRFFILVKGQFLNVESFSNIDSAIVYMRKLSVNAILSKISYK